MGKTIGYKPRNDCIVCIDIVIMWGGEIEDFEGIIHVGALRVHVDEAGDGERGMKEGIFENVGVDFFAFEKIFVVSTSLEGRNANSEIIIR